MVQLKAYKEIKELRGGFGFLLESDIVFRKSDPSDLSNPGPTQDFELEDISWDLINKAKGDLNSLTSEEP